MKTCPQMQRLITQLAARWELDLAADEAHLKLENRSCVPLVIEKVGPTLVSVAHHVEENGDLSPDPEVLFFTGYGPWVPIEVARRPPAGYRAYAELSPNGREITRLDPGGQENLARFAENWANNLAQQGWLGYSRKAAPEPERAPETDYPVLEHLGAKVWIAQASFNYSQLYHAVLLGHQTALKAVRAALWAGQYLAFPDTGQAQRPSYAAPVMVGRAQEVTYHSRIGGDRERGLYVMAIWADNKDLLEKGRSFYLVDPHASPCPMPDYDYGSRRPALPLPSAETLERFYAWLNEALEVPLRKEWAGQLWEEGSRTPTWSPLISVAFSLGCAG